MSPACLLASPSLCGQMPDAGSRVVSPACLPPSPSLCGQVPDTVTPAPGSCLPLVSSPSFYQSLRSDARSFDAGSGVVSPACLPVLFPCLPKVSMPDAGCGVVSPACLPVFPKGLCGRMPDVVTPPAGLPLVFFCVSQSPRSDARCCDAGSGVVSPACLPVSPSFRGQMPDAVTPAPGSCLPLVSLCLPVSAVGSRTPVTGCQASQVSLKTG